MPIMASINHHINFISKVIKMGCAESNQVQEATFAIKKNKSAVTIIDDNVEEENKKIVSQMRSTSDHQEKVYIFNGNPE